MCVSYLDYIGKFDPYNNCTQVWEISKCYWNFNMNLVTMSTFSKHLVALVLKSTITWGMVESRVNFFIISVSTPQQAREGFYC